VALRKAFLNSRDSSSDWAQGGPVRVLNGKLDSLLGGGKGKVPEPKEEKLKDIPQCVPSFY